MCSREYINGNGETPEESAALQLPTFDELVFGQAGEEENSTEPYTPRHAR
jgi:hypothetical protein